MNKIEFTGKVFSGEGGGKKFLELNWVKRQITTLLGFAPYAGTLNIRLSDTSAAHRKLLEQTKAMIIQPAGGYSSGKLFKADIKGIMCAVVIPEVGGYPTDILEVIAAVNLRDRLQLADGDEIAVTVNI